MWKQILILAAATSTLDYSAFEHIAVFAFAAGWAYAAFRRGRSEKTSQDLSDANNRIQLKDSEIRDLKRIIQELQKVDSETKQKLGEATGRLAILEQYDGKAVVETLSSALTAGMDNLRQTLDAHMSTHTKQLLQIEANTKPQRSPAARSRKTDKP